MYREKSGLILSNIVQQNQHTKHDVLRADSAQINAILSHSILHHSVNATLKRLSFFDTAMDRHGPRNRLLCRFILHFMPQFVCYDFQNDWHKKESEFPYYEQRDYADSDAQCASGAVAVAPEFGHKLMNGACLATRVAPIINSNSVRAHLQKKTRIAHMYTRNT